MTAEQAADMIARCLRRIPAYVAVGVPRPALAARPMMTLPDHEVFMDTLYPGWRAYLLAMVHLASERAGLGVYRPGPKGKEDLTALYDELYLAITNATPHKPSTIEGSAR